MKKAVLLLTLLLFLPSLATAITWEDQYAKLTVTPTVAYFNSLGYVQRAELCSKVGSEQNLNLAFLFDSRLTQGRIFYNGNEYSNLIQYAHLNPQNYGFDSDKENMYRYEDLNFQPYECKNFIWQYKTAGSGKWDLAAWLGDIASPTRTWLLDPLFNNTYYVNNFFTGIELTEVPTQFNISISEGNVSLTRESISTSSSGNLTHYWKLNEESGNAEDSIGGWTLTATNGEYVSAKINNGYQANSPGESLINNTITLKIYNETTIEAWIKPSQLVNLLGFYTAPSSEVRFGSQQYSSTGKIIFIMSYCVSECISIFTDYTNNYVFDGSTWYHITGIIDFEKNILQFYLHDSSGNLLENPGNVSMTFNPFTANQFEIGDGAMSGGANAIFDEVRIWNDTRMQSEIESTILSEIATTSSSSNATFGHIISTNISSFLMFQSVNASFIADSKSQHINLSISNDGGANWVLLKCDNVSINWTCNGSSFSNSDNVLKFYVNLTSLDGGTTSPMLSNLTIQLLDTYEDINITHLENSSIYEGTQTSYYLNLTADLSFVSDIVANLTFNGTTYNITKMYNTSDTFVFRTDITTPFFLNHNSPTSVYSFWNYTVITDNFNITDIIPITQTLNLGFPVLTLCNASYPDVTVNFSVKDESNGTDLFATADFDFDYWITGRESYNQSLELTSVGPYHAFSFCYSPSSVTLTSDYTIQYSSTDYPERRYGVNNDLFTNTTRQKALYLVLAADGIYARFKTVDAYGNVLSGVTVTMTTVVSESTVTVEQETTDGSGIATFFVDPNTDYTFTFELTGYETQTYSLRPTTSEIYTVTMTAEASNEVEDSFAGINYYFMPSNGSLNNNTVTLFSFNLTSSLWAITSCLFRLKYTNGTTAKNSTASFTTSSCDIGFEFNTGNLDYIIGEALFSENYTNNITVTYAWRVSERYVGEYSLKNVIDDISAFSGAGFNDFTRMIIAFILIAGLTFSISKFAELTNLDGIIILIIVLVWLFSFIGWLTVSQFVGLTIPSGQGLINLRQYMIAYVTLLGGFGFMLLRAR